VDADWSVELGVGEATLEVPWAAPDGRLRFVDLRAHPEQVDELEEVRRYPEMGEFLRAMNGASSRLVTAKCDVWESCEIEPAEEIFEATHKVGSYCDVILERGRLSFTRQEAFVRRVAEILRGSPWIPASSEFVVRRCVFREAEASADGFCITCFLVGYGKGRAAALRQWRIALHLVSSALLQTAAQGSAPDQC